MIAGRRLRLEGAIVERCMNPAHGAPAARVVAGIDEDPADPGVERGALAEIVTIAVRPEKRLLDGVFGVGDIAEQVEGKALHSRSVRCEEGLEGGEIGAQAVPVTLVIGTWTHECP
jgi:hypothetical protein